jgi:hypothetical protein
MLPISGGEQECQHTLGGITEQPPYHFWVLVQLLEVAVPELCPSFRVVARAYQRSNIVVE